MKKIRLEIQIPSDYLQVTDWISEIDLIVEVINAGIEKKIVNVRKPTRDGRHYMIDPSIFDIDISGVASAGALAYFVRSLFKFLSERQRYLAEKFNAENQPIKIKLDDVQFEALPKDAKKATKIINRLKHRSGKSNKKNLKKK